MPTCHPILPSLFPHMWSTAAWFSLVGDHSGSSWPEVGETERTEGVAALLGRGGVRESFLPLKNWAVWSRLHPRGTLSLGSAAAGRFRKGVGRMG